MVNEDSPVSKTEMLALPQGENPKQAWSELLMRTVGVSGFSFSIGGGLHHIPQWEHTDRLNLDDPYRYQTREPNIRWVHIDYYAGWFRRGKEWYPDIEDWIEAKAQIQDFHKTDMMLVDRYRQRHTRGQKAYIKLAQVALESAPKHLSGFKRDHMHLEEFNRTSKEPYSAFLKSRYGINIDPAALPDRVTPPLHIPEHRGIKQMAILLDKIDRTSDAIDVCRQALQIGWPGDWENRLSRYAKRLERLSDTANPRRKISKRAVGKFCTQCGEALDLVDLFCGSCGASRK